jgi:hypothetical protein
MGRGNVSSDIPSFFGEKAERINIIDHPGV